MHTIFWVVKQTCLYIVTWNLSIINYCIYFVTFKLLLVLEKEDVDWLTKKESEFSEKKQRLGWDGWRVQMIPHLECNTGNLRSIPGRLLTRIMQLVMKVNTATKKSSTRMVRPQAKTSSHLSCLGRCQLYNGWLSYPSAYDVQRV